MYSVAGRLDPGTYFALARAVYAEMALAGITCVGEFHYLHHGPGGKRYRDPNEMGRVLIAAAAAAGLRITLLDACYLAAGFRPDGEPLPLAGVQLRFGDGSAAAWAERVSGFTRDSLGMVGAARPARRRDPLGPRGPAGPGARGDGVVARARGAGPRAPVRAAAGERRVPGGVRRDPRRVALRRGGRSARASTMVHATHLT